jgi:hypothetical protein
VTAAHVVHPGDEARHTPDEAELWNESYYFDFVQASPSPSSSPSSPSSPSSSASSLPAVGTDLWGGWLRLGLYPNRRVAWWTAWLLGTDREGNRQGICCADYAAPVPADGRLDSSSALADVDLEIVRQLEECRLVVPRMQCKHFARPEDAYLDIGWQPVEASLDLTWTTDGAPYHYILTTRYEIPCLVTGHVTIGDQTFSVNGQGQRDHSWGVRDWWAFGWCWSSARLDDGTRVHLADIRIPGSPAFFGYVQVPGPGDATRVHTITSLSVSEDLGPEGFPTAARIEMTATDMSGGPDSTPHRDEETVLQLGIDVEPLAYGPVLLRDDDGRTSRFPRALVRYRTDDGRNGVGWIEWNQPQP